MGCASISDLLTDYAAETAHRSTNWLFTNLLSLGWIIAWLGIDQPVFVFSLFATAWVNAAIVLTAWILLTGGLHLDGLSDSADAWVGGMSDRTRTLAIMKDPNCGPMGVIAIVLIILLKFVALYTLIQALQSVALLASIVLARTSLVLLFLTTPYVRNIGLGSCLAANHSSRWCILIISAVCFLITFFVENGFFYIVSAVMVFLLLRQAMMNRIGGTTGDTAGGLVEVVETIVLIIATFFY